MGKSRNCSAFRGGIRRLGLASTVVVTDDRYTETALEKLVALLGTVGAAMADGLVIKCLAENRRQASDTIADSCEYIFEPGHTVRPVRCLPDMIDAASSAALITSRVTG